MPPARCSSGGCLSYYPAVFRLQWQGLPCAPAAACRALGRQAPGTLETGLSLSLRLLPQAPTGFSLVQTGCPDQEGFVLGWSLTPHCGALGSGKQQQPKDPTRTSRRMLSFRRGFPAWRETHFAAASQQGFGRSLSRVREDVLWESWCLLGLAFPGPRFAPFAPAASTTSGDVA